MDAFAAVARNLRLGLAVAFGEGKTVDADRAEYVVRGLATQRVGVENIDAYTDPEDIRGLAADHLLAFVNAAWATWDNHLADLAQQ